MFHSTDIARIASFFNGNGLKSRVSKRRAGRRSELIEPLEQRLLLFANNSIFSTLAPVRAPVHEDITSEGLHFLKTEVIEELQDANVSTDLGPFDFLNDALHFDNSNFTGAATSIRTLYQDAVTEANPEDFDSDAVAAKFGRLLHSVQDFYSHSNWADQGITQIVDDTLNEWPTMTPYSTVGPDIVLLQGVAPAGTVISSDPGNPFRVRVNGTKKGIVSGGFGGDSQAPVGARFAHDDLNHDHNGDSDGDPGPRPLFAEARALAVLQTTHEFARLGSLIEAEYGHEGVCNLLEEWVNPDEASQAQARELLGIKGAPIDLVFVIDTTGSMSDDIAAVKAAATEIINRISEASPCFQVGIVLYKDAGDVYVTQTALPFTNDAAVANAAIQSITVEGGGDFPEAVFAALDHAILNLDGLGSWRGGAIDGVGGIPKKIILMGDAPPHDPDQSTGVTAADVAQHAFDADPVDIFPIVIGDNTTAIASFQAIAAANRGQLFVAPTADDVVNAIFDAIDVIGGGGNGAIQGRKWHDANQNGVHDGGEEWLNGWTVELVNSSGGVAGTATTADIDLNGNGTIESSTERGVYRFTGVANDVYEVREVVPAGWQQSFPISPIATLAFSLDAANEFRTTANNFQDWAGLQERWLLSNNGWHYVTPAGGLFKWTSGRGATLQSQFVAKLNPDFYNNLDLLGSAVAPQTHRVTITTDTQVTGVDFGNYGASTIQGQKWEDSDADGVRDSSERFLNGWEIQLVDTATGAVVQSTTTQSIDLNLDGRIDSQTEVGVYQFGGVKPGKYEVREILKTGWIQSSPTRDLLTLAHDLDTSRAFDTSNGSFLDWGKLSEKWLLGNDGWYFITPDGALSKWNLSPRTALTGTKVAQLSPWFYAQPSRLANAVDPSDVLIDTTNEIHVTGANIGNYRANGASGLKVSGKYDPTFVPGNVTVTVSGGNIRVVGDKWDNQVGLFVDWNHNLIAVGLQGTTVNGRSGPFVVLGNTSTVSGSLFVDMNAGNDLIALQGFKTGKNVWINGGNGADCVLTLDMQIGGNFHIASGWGAGTVALSNTSIANNLTILGSEAQDDVLLDRVVVSNHTIIYLGGSDDRLITRGSMFHDNAYLHLGVGNDVVIAWGTNDFKRLLWVNGSVGNDTVSAASVPAGRKTILSIESDHVPDLSGVLDQVLSELASLGLDDALLN